MHEISRKSQNSLTKFYRPTDRQWNQVKEKHVIKKNIKKLMDLKQKTFLTQELEARSENLFSPVPQTIYLLSRRFFLDPLVLCHILFFIVLDLSNRSRSALCFALLSGCCLATLGFFFPLSYFGWHLFNYFLWQFHSLVFGFHTNTFLALQLESNLLRICISCVLTINR